MNQFEEDSKDLQSLLIILLRKHFKNIRMLLLPHLEKAFQETQ
jgi:hypothetical protein